MAEQKQKKEKLENKITIEDIHAFSKELFLKYNYPVLDHNIEQKNAWCDFISGKLDFDKNEFWSLNSEFFWTLLNTEISIGYVLIARQSCLYPFGIKKVGYDIDDTMPESAIPEVHYWYHVNNTRECIYRCWERITSILKYVCYSDKKDKFYFPAIVNEILKDQRYSENPTVKQLKKYEEFWTKDSGRRNSLSHGASSPFIKDKTQVDVSNLYGSRNEVLFRITTESPDLIREIEDVKNSYVRMLDVWSAVKQFIESLINEQNKI